MATLEAKLSGLQDRPGVYFLKDALGKVVYVGKAANLRKRVSSHFKGPPVDSRESRLRTAIKDFDFIATNSETEALVLECNWIKRSRPEFNIRFADDKSYPYVRVTLQHLFPLVMITRKVRSDGAKYFGPYGDVGAVRRTVKYLRRIFPVRNCTLKIDESSRIRPCLEYHIKRCAAPCGGLVNPAEYRGLVEGFCLYIEGRQEHLLRALYAQMKDASNKMEYERAAVVRDRIRSLERTVQGQQVVLPHHEDIDVIGVASLEGRACAQLLNIRDGKLVDQKKYFLQASVEDPPSALVSAFVKQYYSAASEIPSRIVLPHRIEEPSLLREWLRHKKGRHVAVVQIPRRKDKHLIEIANKNAKAALMQDIPRFELRQKLTRGAIADLKEQLCLPTPPNRLEAFDVSALKGGDAVGSLVVFQDGEPAKNEYRRFRVKTVKYQNDYAMMHEIVLRRYRRVLEEKGPAPDLILVDGGPGHLKAARHALNKLGLDRVPAIGLAKRLELIYKPGATLPLSLPPDSRGLYLLQHIRNEAHRFAITYHRKLRTRRAKASILDGVPGIGERRRQNLLLQFNSVEDMRRASMDELAAVRGMTKNSAVLLYEHLHRAAAT